MRNIVYYVGTSIDGYIAGPDEDISGFIPEGNGIEKYLKDLEDFDTVIMGKNTYEFGYKFGLAPGKNPYPHMKCYVFSNTLKLKNADKNVQVCKPNLEFLRSLKQEQGSDIYLCGGSQFANWLLEHEVIDFLKIKLNPFIQGNGTKIFSNPNKVYKLELMDSERYDHGLQIITYKINYS